MDRIAYCGKVPANVIGANVGDWIVPIAAQDGTITAEAVPDPAVTFDQFRKAVGRVRSIGSDGRPIVAVGVK